MLMDRSARAAAGLVPVPEHNITTADFFALYIDRPGGQARPGAADIGGKA